MTGVYAWVWVGFSAAIFVFLYVGTGHNWGLTIAGGVFAWAVLFQLRMMVDLLKEISEGVNEHTNK